MSFCANISQAAGLSSAEAAAAAASTQLDSTRLAVMSAEQWKRADERDARNNMATASRNKRKLPAFCCSMTTDGVITPKILHRKAPVCAQFSSWSRRQKPGSRCAMKQFDALFLSGSCTHCSSDGASRKRLRESTKPLHSNIRKHSANDCSSEMEANTKKDGSAQ